METSTQAMQCVPQEIMQLIMLGCYVSPAAQRLLDHCSVCPKCDATRRQVNMMDARIDGYVSTYDRESFNAFVVSLNGVIHVIPKINTTRLHQIAYPTAAGNLEATSYTYFVIPKEYSPINEELKVYLDRRLSTRLNPEDPAVVDLGGLGIRPTLYLRNRATLPFPNHNITAPFKFENRGAA